VLQPPKLFVLATKNQQKKLKNHFTSGLEKENEVLFLKRGIRGIRQIPTGRVTSYGAIAVYLGTKMSAHMVELNHE